MLETLVQHRIFLSQTGALSGPIANQTQAKPQDAAVVEAKLKVKTVLDKYFDREKSMLLRAQFRDLVVRELREK